MLLGKPNSPTLDRVIALVSPHIFWGDILHGRNAVIRWAVAVSAVPHTEAIGQSVVDTLLQLSDNPSFRPYIPIGTWAWLKKVKTLPPVCHGRTVGSWPEVVRQVRRLGDVEILKSYFLLVWSEWDYLYSRGLREMEISVKEDFAGIEMWGHRVDLVKRLDHVLGQLDRGLGYLNQHDPQIDQYHVRTALTQYRRLKEVLLDADGEMMRVLARAPFEFVRFNEDTNSSGCAQNPAPPSVALCLPRVRDFMIGTGYVAPSRFTPPRHLFPSVPLEHNHRCDRCVAGFAGFSLSSFCSQCSVLVGRAGVFPLLECVTNQMFFHSHALRSLIRGQGAICSCRTVR